MTTNSEASASISSLSSRLEQAIAAREPLLDEAHHAAVRLFNGFREDCPELVVDLYGSTVLIHNYAEPPTNGTELVHEAARVLQSSLTWVRAAIVKERHSESTEGRHGRLLFGGAADDRILENGIWYAIDLTLGRDASFYLDTRNLRQWTSGRLRGKTVLNAFAYTGSLGVAAAAAGASRVVQLDRNGRYLRLAKRSCSLNKLPTADSDFIQGDFFRQAGKFRRKEQRFDCVFMDAPFFAAGSTGTVDQVHESARLINKARPLVEDGGYLVAINNALYVSGSEYLATLEQLCSDGYLRLSELIPVPEDCTGYGPARQALAVADPAPFNHSTKIAVLEVRRKKGQSG